MALSYSHRYSLLGNSSCRTGFKLGPSYVCSIYSYRPFAPSTFITFKTFLSPRIPLRRFAVFSSTELPKTFDFSDEERIYNWYIEASKTRFVRKEDTSTTVCAQAVLLYVFGNVLKLLHPFMPYVTEELWQALPARNSALIVADWPKMLLPRDKQAVNFFENLQALIRAIRNARAEYSVEPARRISATIVASPNMQDYICNEKTVLATLSRLEIENLHFTHAPPEHAKLAVHLIVREGLGAYLPVTDMVDISTEIQRVSKQLTKLQSEYDGHMKHLTSPNFVGKAPAAVVQRVRDKVNEAQEKLGVLNRRLAFLQSTILSSK